MLHPSTKRLIDKLNDMTRKQRVAWTEGENATVVHDTEGYRVVLTPEPHSVLLTDAVGREIETCLPEEFADEVDGHGRPYSKFVAELYREASRHARGTEKAISTLLAGLDAVAEAQPDPAPPAVVLPEPAFELRDAVTDETAPFENETEITAAIATLADKINTPNAAENEPEPELDAAAEPDQAPAIASEAEPESQPEAVADSQQVETETLMEAEPPAPSVDVAPLEEEPGSFGTFGAFQTEHPEPASEPGIEPVPELDAVSEVIEEPAAVLPEPEPAAAAAPQPEPVAAPTVPRLTQPISLSAIPFGFGLGAAQRSGVVPSEPKPAPEPAVQSASSGRMLIDGTLDLPESSPADYHDDVSAEPYPPPEPQAGPKDIPGDSTLPPEPGNPRRFNPWN